MRFQNFYEDANDKNWRERKVYHMTPVTKKRTLVKIKSLSPEEQEKYKPIELMTPEERKTLKKVEIKSLPEKNLLELFLILDNPDDIKNISHEDMIKSTVDSSTAIKYSDKGKYIVKVLGVPVDAFISYKNDKNEWYDIDSDMTDDEKYNFIKFGEHKMFLVNIYKWRNILHFKDIGDADIKIEGIKYIDRLLIENEVGFLDQKFIMKLINHLEKMFPTYAELDNGINIELRNVIKVGDGKNLKKVKQRIHDILQRAKTKLLRDVQNKVEKIKAIRKDNSLLVQPTVSDKIIPDETSPQNIENEEE